MSTSKWAAFTDDELSLLEDWALNYEGAGPLHERLRDEVEAEHVRRGRPAPKPTGRIMIQTMPRMPDTASMDARLHAARRSIAETLARSLASSRVSQDIEGGRR